MVRKYLSTSIFSSFLMGLILAGFSSTGSAQNWMDYGDSMVPNGDQKVTFIELGADKCFSCRMMQPIMKNLKSRYPNDLKVVFINVWQNNGDIAGKKYNIRVIPTQVFFNAQGEEIYRHEGFFAENQIEALLKDHGVKQ